MVYVNDVPEVFDQIHCILEHNCFYQGHLWDQCLFVTSCLQMVTYVSRACGDAVV